MFFFVAVDGQEILHGVIIAIFIMMLSTQRNSLPRFSEASRWLFRGLLVSDECAGFISSRDYQSFLRRERKVGMPLLIPRTKFRTI